MGPEGKAQGDRWPVEPAPGSGRTPLVRQRSGTDVHRDRRPCRVPHGLIAGRPRTKRRDCRLRPAEKWREGRREESECFLDLSFLPPPAVIRTAQILVVGHDLNFEAQQLHQAFPAPLHRVQVAGTGSVALEHVRTHPLDVILLDMDLSDRSGIEADQEIRCINPRIPIIVVTRAKQAKVAIETMKQGTYDCLFPPLDLPLLRRVVGEALDVACRIRQASPEEEAPFDSEEGCELVDTAERRPTPTARASSGLCARKSPRPGTAHRATRIPRPCGLGRSNPARGRRWGRRHTSTACWRHCRRGRRWVHR